MASDWYVKTDKFGSTYAGKNRQQADQKAEELKRQGAKWWEIIDPDNSSVGGGYVEHEKQAGVDEKDSPEQKYGKIKAHFGRKAMMEAGIADADTPDVAMAKFAKHMEAGDASATGSQQHKEPDKDNLMEGPSAIKGAPTEIDPGSVSDKVVGGHVMERETVRAMSEQIKQDRAKIQAMQGQLAVMERAQKKEAATKAVDTAWQSGRIVPLPGESAEKAKARFLVKYEKDPAMFADDLAPVGTHHPSAHG